MPRHRAVFVSAILATFMPAVLVYAADAVPVTQPDDASTLQHQFRQALPRFHSAPGIRPESRTGGLRFETETAPSPSPTDAGRYRLASGAGSALNLSPSMLASRTGWQFSGRAGPMRWMTPLDGEGETAVRFGGRVPGQPRMPGTGLFNLGVHYTFE